MLTSNQVQTEPHSKTTQTLDFLTAVTGRSIVSHLPFPKETCFVRTRIL